MSNYKVGIYKRVKRGKDNPKTRAIAVIVAVIIAIIIGTGVLIPNSVEVVTVEKDYIKSQLERLEAVSKDLEQANKVLEKEKAEHKEAVNTFIETMVDYEAVKGDVMYNIQSATGYYE